MEGGVPKETLKTGKMSDINNMKKQFEERLKKGEQKT